MMLTDDFFPTMKPLMRKEQRTVCRNFRFHYSVPSLYFNLFIQWQVSPDAPVSHSWGHIQQQHPSIRVFLERCGNWGGLTTLPLLSLTWRRPRLCIGMCWAPQWVTRFPCLSMVSTQCLWNLETQNWSCYILLERRARSLAFYRRTSPEGCTTFVLRWDRIDSML